METTYKSPVSRVVARWALIGTLSALPFQAAMASPIAVDPATINMFRDTRGDNNAGLTAGDRFQFGGNVLGGSAGTSVRALYPQVPNATFASSLQPCSPLPAISQNFCASTTAFNVNRTAEPWTIEFQRPGETTLNVAGPSLVGTETAVPHPVDVSISGAGLTPTISWTVPGNFVADAVRINVFNLSSPLLQNGQHDVILSTPIAATANSYTLPSGLLANGTNYSLTHV